jgi:hypothetical protein
MASSRAVHLRYGEYLVTLAGCIECHTPAKQGKLVQGMTLAGGQEFRFPGAMAVSANIGCVAKTILSAKPNHSPISSVDYSAFNPRVSWMN